MRVRGVLLRNYTRELESDDPSVPRRWIISIEGLRALTYVDPSTLPAEVSGHVFVKFSRASPSRPYFVFYPDGQG